MTAQNHNFHNDECRDHADQAAAEIDPLGPIALPTRRRIGARATALSGLVGVAAVALATQGDPSTVFTTSVSVY